LVTPAAKDNRITHPVAAPSSLDTKTTMRFAEIELQNTIELYITASAIAAPKPDLDATVTKNDFAALFKRTDKKKIANTIYEIQLQRKKELRTQPRHQATLTQPLACDLQRLTYKIQ